MKLFVSGATTTMHRYAGHAALGKLITPDNGNALDGLSGWECGSDNSALGKHGVRVDALLDLWDELQGAQNAGRLPGLKFVTAPDAVEMTPTGPRGSWEGTLALWRVFYSALIKRNLPAAIVLQDGATTDTIPWDSVAAIFIGGSTRWKQSKYVGTLIRQAARRGTWVHVGRINTMQRLNYFDALPVNSFDGTQFSMFPDTYIPRWIQRLGYKQEGFKHAC